MTSLKIQDSYCWANHFCGGVCRVLLSALDFIIRIWTKSWTFRKKKKRNQNTHLLGLHYEIGKPFHLLFILLCCLSCFIFLHVPGQRPVVIEFSPLSPPMEREGELKATEKRTLEEGPLTCCFAIFQPGSLLQQPGSLLQPESGTFVGGRGMKRNRLCYKQVFVIMKPLQSMRSELGYVPK